MLPFRKLLVPKKCGHLKWPHFGMSSTTARPALTTARSLKPRYFPKFYLRNSMLDHYLRDFNPGYTVTNR